MNKLYLQKLLLPPPLVQQGIEEELNDALRVETFDQSGTAVRWSRAVGGGRGVEKCVI